MTPNLCQAFTHIAATTIPEWAYTLTNHLREGGAAETAHPVRLRAESRTQTPMSESDYQAEAKHLDSSTRQYVYDHAYEYGGLEDQTIPEFTDQMVREVKAGADEYFDMSELGLRQAILEEVTKAVDAMAEDGYDEHF